MHFKVILAFIAILTFQRLTAKELTLAILGDRENNDINAICSLLEVKLTEKGGFALLDRTQIDEVLKEQKLSAFISDPKKRIALGRLLKADILVYFETQKNKLSLTILEGNLGLRLGSYSVQKDLELAVKFSASMLEISIKKLNNPLKKLIVIPPLKSLGINAHFDKYSQVFANSIEEKLLNHSDFIVVEYKNIQEIIKELSLHAVMALDKRSLPYHLKGEFKNLDQTPNSPFSLSLSLHFNGKQLDELKHTKISSVNSKKTIQRFASQLTDKIADVEAPVIDRKKDAEEMFKRAEEGLLGDNRADGVRLYEAALALDPDNLKARIKLTREITKTFGNSRHPNMVGRDYLSEAYLRQVEYLCLKSDLTILKSIKDNRLGFVFNYLRQTEKHHRQLREICYAYTDRIIKLKKSKKEEKYNYYLYSNYIMGFLFGTIQVKKFMESEVLYERFLKAVQCAVKLQNQGSMWGLENDSLFDSEHDNQVTPEQHTFRLKFLKDLKKFNSPFVDVYADILSNHILDSDYDRMIVTAKEIQARVKKNFSKSSFMHQLIKGDIFNLTDWKNYHDRVAGKVVRKAEVIERSEFKVSIKKLSIKTLINIHTLPGLENKMRAVAKSTAAKAFDGVNLWYWSQKSQTITAINTRSKAEMKFDISKVLPHSDKIDICPVTPTHFLVVGSVKKRKWVARIKLVKNKIDFKILLEAREIPERSTNDNYFTYKRHKNPKLIFSYQGMVLLIDPKNSNNRRVIIYRLINQSFPLIYDSANESLTAHNESIPLFPKCAANEGGKIYFFQRILNSKGVYTGRWLCSFGFPDFKVNKIKQFKEFNFGKNKAIPDNQAISLWENKLFLSASQNGVSNTLWVVDLKQMSLANYKIFNEDEKKENRRTLEYINDPVLGLIGLDYNKYFKVKFDKPE